MRDALTSYIEATYHLSHPKLVALRKALLLAGGVSQVPFIESTASYVAKRPFDTLALPPAVRSFLTSMATEEHGRVLFDPPYEHQAEALEMTSAGAGCGHAAVVTTGTGSGKTETFLLPILARLAEEAALRPAHFKQRAIRALLLYPMNALVNDQLGRLRNLFGATSVRQWFDRTGGRPAKFGRYTGRTLYPGFRTVKRDQARLKSLNYFLSVEDSARDGDPDNRDLINKLKEKGRWPSKPDSTAGAFDGLRDWFGRPSQKWSTSTGEPARAIERVQDPELLSRHEIQGACPDLLVTNYSMLEYMLLRPIERDIFSTTRDYYEQNPEETLFFILDEAHLYRGANGTEVAYLIRRVLDRLKLPLSRVAFIVTSASFSNPESAKEFVAGLTGLAPDAVTVITGEKKSFEPAGPGTVDLAEALSDIPLQDLQAINTKARSEIIIPLAQYRSEIGGHPVTLQRKDNGSAAISAVVSGIGQNGVRIEETVSVAAHGKAVTRRLFLLVDDVQVNDGVVKFARVHPLGEARANENTVWDHDDLPAALAELLQDLPVIGRLKNITAGAVSAGDNVQSPGAAWPIPELSHALFPDSEVREPALDAILEIASLAREKPTDPPILPARVHMFFRGLPGVWACSNPQCEEISPDHRDGPTGKLFAEPRLVCGCQSQVYELHSCRSCGLAVAHANIAAPAGIEHLWQDSGRAYIEDSQAVEAVHVCLEDPGGPSTSTRAAFLDTKSGRIDGPPSASAREVWLPQITDGYLFSQCPRCGTSCSPTSSNGISDLQTKGEQPFQELVTVQVLEQPPRPEVTTALRGRKALIFSDGRQTASRLAGTLKTFSFRDSVRPLLLAGMQDLSKSILAPSLDDSPMAVALAAANRDVRLRPIGDTQGDMVKIGVRAKEIANAEDSEVDDFRGLSDEASSKMLKSFFQSLYAVLHDRHTGLSSLALAKLRPKLTKFETQRLRTDLKLPQMSGTSEDDVRDALICLWLWQAMSKRAVHLSHTPPDLIDAAGGVHTWNGKFSEEVQKLLKAQGYGNWLKNEFLKVCEPTLSAVFGYASPGGYFVNAAKVKLDVAPDDEWMRCERCTSVAPANALIGNHCAYCGGATHAMDPVSDPVFRSRKSFFRRLWERMSDPSDAYEPHMLVAEEHSAALNDTGQINALSRNEAYELRFQDIPIVQDGQVGTPIDILSCTTTMEVGIDIGGLTAVALRNVPPGRANYQQRAGRAGRRGSGLATVVTYCGADSHDQNFFREPAPIVAGPAPDPILNLDNPVIARRQAYAYILGLFQQERISLVGASADVFSSLGRVNAFLNGDASAFSVTGLKQWISDGRSDLLSALQRLFVASCPSLDAEEILNTLPAVLEERLAQDGEAEEQAPAAPTPPADGMDQDPADEIVEDENDEVIGKSENGKLLDRLFDESLLPKYAFPTDVATFNVFEDGTDPWNPKRRYSPQLGLNAALSQYAPGNEVWVDGQRYLSLGLYSEHDDDRFKAYKERKLYYNCRVCGFAELRHWEDGHLDETTNCPACARRGSLGPARRWVRPPGFAHPPGIAPNPPNFDSGLPLRPTRATLDALKFDDDLRIGSASWPMGTGWEGFTDNQDLVVTNRGTQSTTDYGFNYCNKCGRIEPAEFDPAMRRLNRGQLHPRPRPKRPKEADECDGQYSKIVLGNQFKTDVAVFRLAFPSNWSLEPDRSPTTIAARSAVEALRRAACKLDDLEPNDIDGDFRFAPGSDTVQFIDLYLYDQAAGGAGFVRAATRDPQRLVNEAISLLENCSCDDSCYQCLRSYRNRFDHQLFDRRIGADLLRTAFKGLPLRIDPDHASAALTRLEADINASGAHVVRADGGLVDDKGRLICLAHPFLPAEPIDPVARQYAGEVVPIDLLLILRALPIATNQALTIGGQANAASPQPDSGGVPELSDEQASGGISQPGPDAARYAVPGAQDGDFLFRLTANTLSGPKGDGAGPVAKGSLCLFRPVIGPIDDKGIYLVYHPNGDAFGATGKSWTVGTLQQKGSEGTRVRYRADSKHLECASELIPAAKTVVPFAEFVKVVS